MRQLAFTSRPASFVGMDHKIPSFLPRVKTARQSLLLRLVNRNPALKQGLRTYLKPLVALLDYRSTLIYLFVDGYIQRAIGHFIRGYVKKGIVLEVGIGGGKLLKYFDFKRCSYFGFDIYDVSAVGLGRPINLFVASAESIPLADASVDYIVSTEVFEHIPNFPKALREMYRVSKPHGKLIVSIPNLYSIKHDVKGPQPDNFNKWHYREFIDQVSAYFSLLEGRMTGFWIPIFPKMRYSIQIAYSHPDEYYNSNFFYVFECKK